MVYGISSSGTNACATGTSCPPLRFEGADVRFTRHDYFMNIMAGECCLSAPCRIDAEAMKFMVEYRWPGNVRQLQYVLRGASVHSENGVITLDIIKAELQR